MSVPDGYKQTEAGIIPDKWKAVPLLSVFRLQADKWTQKWSHISL